MKHREPVGTLQQPLELWVPQFLWVRRFETPFGDTLDRCVEPVTVTSISVQGRCCEDISVQGVDAPETVAILHD
jgi:hypothetical protein